MRVAQLRSAGTATPPKVTFMVEQFASVQSNTSEPPEVVVVVVEVGTVVVGAVVVVVGTVVVVVIFGGCKTTRSAMTVPLEIVSEFIIAFEVCDVNVESYPPLRVKVLGLFRIRSSLKIPPSIFMVVP